MQLSVILATKNRADQLANALASLTRQSLPSESFEVLVVDNNSQDHTSDVLQRYANLFPNWKPLFQEKPGAAAARNACIRHACGKILLFMDDDLVADPALLEEHLALHREMGNIAVLGSVRFPWSGMESPLFQAFHRHPELYQSFRFSDPQSVPFLHFYTCNLSIPSRFFEEHGLFDEDFTASGFEDIEMGFRFVQAGHRIVFNSKASALHDVRVSFSEFSKKRYAGGQWLHLLLVKQPLLAPYFLNGATRKEQVRAMIIGRMAGLFNPVFRASPGRVPAFLLPLAGQLCWFRLQYCFWSGFRDAARVRPPTRMQASA